MYEYRALVASVYDGDTVRLDVDLGFNCWLHRVPFRLTGIDAAELGKSGGLAARDWLRAMLPVGSELIVLTQKDKADKYGRWLGELYAGDVTTSINRRLIDYGYAVPYDGGPR